MGVSALCAALSLSPLGGCARAVLLLSIAGWHAVPTALYPELITPRPSVDRDPYRHPFNSTTDFDEEIFHIL